jgi:hypothetical protein
VADLPPLPSLRALTAELREQNEAYSHPIAGASYVALCCVRGYDNSGERGGWCLVETGSIANIHGDILAQCGCEEVPGDCPEVECTCRNGWRILTSEAGGPESCRACGGTGHRYGASKWDAVAAARRLLAAARDV